MHPFTRIKIGKSGEQLPESATEYVATLFPELGIMVGSSSVGVNNAAAPQKQIAEACARVQLAGFNDWTLADTFETQLAMDRSKDPCIDTAFFPGVKADWHWTRDGAPWSSASAFGVYFDDGGVLSSRRDDLGFGLPVRRVAGQ